MRKKLSGRKANTLSFAGRVTVAQTSLASIPGYVLQSTPIPAAVCEEAERICRDFLWGSTADARKCHLINWETICRPKDEGGLGFRSLSLLNQAYMMKLAWGLVATPSKFWVRVLRAKYSCGPAAVPNVQNRNNASALWRAIVGTWEGVKKNLNWVIRDGQGVRFWKDAWLPGWPNMHEELGDNVPVAELDFPVSYYAHGGAWNWSKIRPFLAADICNRIAVVQPPLPGNKGFPCWASFSIKSAFLFLQEERNIDAGQTSLFKLAWSWQGPTRYKAFLWKLCHDKLLTNEERCRRIRVYVSM